MVLSNVDRELLDRCLRKEEQAWQDFVDRFLGLGIHVVAHVASCREQNIPRDIRDDLVAEIFLSLLRDDMQILRKFQGKSSLATYLTVIARRVVVRRLQQLKLLDPPVEAVDVELVGEGSHALDDLGSSEEVELALSKLAQNEAQAVRLFHLEGKSYLEIASATGIPENTIGPLLSRARQKIRASLKSS